MNYLLPFAFCLLPLLSFGQQAKVVDQILTLVNDEVITRTDLLWSLALDPRAPNPAGGVSQDILRQKLDVMIDERLIAQEAARIPSAAISREELEKKRADLIRLFANEAVFRNRLEAVGLTAEKLDDLLRQRIVIERFVEFRFQAFVFVTEPEIQSDYERRIVAAYRERGEVPPPLDAVIDGVPIRERIVERLKREKVNDETDRYLSAIRQRAEIVLLAEP